MTSIELPIIQTGPHNNAPTYRAAAQRLQDYAEILSQADLSKVQAETTRCMNCGAPFCQPSSGYGQGCPIENNIPVFNELVRLNRWQEAYEQLSTTNPFPEFTGRVCPAPCQGACIHGLNDHHIEIKSIERTIIDRAFEQGWVRPTPPAQRSGKTIAVIGSGPSGLACAYQLNKLGHTVTVYERDEHPGGLLMHGIPNMKLDKNTVLRRINVLEQSGITFQTRVQVGTDVSTNELREQFDAVVLCIGAKVPRDLPVPGRELQGIHFAVPYLTAATRNLMIGDPARAQPNAKGKDVLVIGGGDTGTDCVATALRQGCKSLVQLELMPEPPEQRSPHNPWPTWPIIKRTDYGHTESIEHFGQDPRRYLTKTDSFLPDQAGNVRAARITTVKWEQTNGRRTMADVPSSTQEIPAQLVLLSMGFLGPEQTLAEQLGITTNQRSNYAPPLGGNSTGTNAARSLYETGIEGVFVAGDCRRGQSLVVWAIQEGLAAAKEASHWLYNTAS